MQNYICNFTLVKQQNKTKKTKKQKKNTKIWENEKNKKQLNIKPMPHVTIYLIYMHNFSTWASCDSGDGKIGLFFWLKSICSGQFQKEKKIK